MNLLGCAQQVNFEACRDDGFTAPALKSMLEAGLASIFNRLARATSSHDHASEKKHFSTDSWLRGVVLPAVSQTWTNIDDATLHDALPGLAKDAMECVRMLQADEVIVAACARTLCDLQSYANLVRAAEDNPTLSMTEVVLARLLCPSDLHVSTPAPTSSHDRPCSVRHDSPTPRG